MDAPKELDAGCDSHQMATTKTCAAQVRSTSFPHNTFPPMSATVQCLSCKKTTLPADHNGLKCSEGCHHVCPGSCSEQYTVKLFQRLQKGEAKHVLYRCPAKPSCNGTIKPTVSCPICLSDDIPFDHDGVRCNAGIHHVCGACAGEYAGTIATELHSTPLDQELKCFKCSDHARSGCTSEVDPDRIRRLLPADAQWSFDAQMAKHCIPPSCKIVHCPSCSYFEMWEKTNTDNFFQCKNTGMPGPDGTTVFAGEYPCGAKSCAFCRREVWPGEEAAHRDCGRLVKLVQKVLDIANPNARCPYGCGPVTFKDRGCTHITCPTCSQRWCYVCEKKEGDCDAGAGTNPLIFRHNTDWKTNPKRCPMYLRYIKAELGALNPDYPSFESGSTTDEQEKAAGEYLQRKRQLRRLREFIDEVGHERYKELVKRFPDAGSHGFDYAEIAATDPSRPLFIGEGARAWSGSGGSGTPVGGSPTVTVAPPPLPTLPQTLHVGMRVRVKPSVAKPKYGWGEVTRECIGTIIRVSSTECIVNFPKHFEWKGVVIELERVTVMPVKSTAAAPSTPPSSKN